MTSQPSGDGAEKCIVNFGSNHRLVRQNGSQLPEHRDETGKWIPGPGFGGWPIANYAEIINRCAHKDFDEQVIAGDIFELETAEEVAGCDEMIMAFCHPPFARSYDEILCRYRDLRRKGVYRITYIYNEYDRNSSKKRYSLYCVKLAEKAALEAGILFKKKRYEKKFINQRLHDITYGSGEVPILTYATGVCEERDCMSDLYIDENIDIDHDDVLVRHRTAIEEEGESLIRGNPFPKPHTDWSGGFMPSEPEKKNNHACAKERARALTAKISHHVRSSDSGPTDWYIQDGTQWKLHDGHDAFNSLYQQQVNDLEWMQQDSTTVNSDRAGIRRSVSSVLPPVIPGLLPFINCCLDVNTRKTVAHSPENGNRYRLEYNYRPSGKPPAKILAFLRQALQDDAAVHRYIAFLHEILLGHSLKMFLEITGPSDGGKSVLTNLAVAIVGQNNTASCELEKLENSNNRFETFFVRGKRLVTCPESQKYTGMGETLKKLTGQDRVRAEKKGSSKKYDFTFAGGVIITGNSPVQFTDVSGAIINRRRSLRVDTPVREVDKRVLCEDDGNGTWRGDLVDEFPDFINFILDMPDELAKQYLARNVVSRSVIESEKAVLLETDSFARWAESELTFDKVQGQYLQMGNSDEDVGLYQQYLDYHVKNEKGEGVDLISQRNFKRKAVELFRDTLGLPLPVGNYQQGLYRVDKVGSVIPYLRLRSQLGGDALSGIITQAFNKRMEPLLQRNTNADNLVRHETNDKNDYSKV